MADHDGIQSVTRRQVLKGGAAIAALGGVSAFLAACSSSAATASPAASAPAASAPAASAPAASAPAASAALGGSLHIGSNHSDPGEKAGMDAINAAFTAATGIDVGDQHRRSRHVPGPDHQLSRRTPRTPRTRGSPASA